MNRTPRPQHNRTPGPRPAHNSTPVNRTPGPQHNRTPGHSVLFTGVLLWAGRGPGVLWPQHNMTPGPGPVHNRTPVNRTPAPQHNSTLGPRPAHNRTPVNRTPVNRTLCPGVLLCCGPGVLFTGVLLWAGRGPSVLLCCVMTGVCSVCDRVAVELLL